MTGTISFVPPPHPGLPGHYLHIPDHLRLSGGLSHAPVLVMVHGISRNALEHVARASRTPGLADRAIVAPLFEPASFGQYQQLDRVEDGARCDLALLALLDHLQDQGLATARVAMFGFSGGAQFAHRFALFHAQRLTALSLAAAGWYTLPGSEAPWPLGLDTSHTELPAPAASALVGLPVQMMVGRGDRLRGPALRTSPALDAAQGRHRLARARRFFAALQTLAEDAGLPSRASLDLLPVAGHEFAAYVQGGQMLQRLAHWLETSAAPPLRQSEPPPNTPPKTPLLTAA